MKIVHYALDINPKNGGPPRSISGLCKALAAQGHDVSLLLHDLRGSEFADLGECRLVKAVDVEAFLRKERPDLVHQHGIWNLPFHQLDIICRKLGIPYVIAPRGSLDSWSLSQKKWKKKLALLTYQRADIRNAAAMHATAESEAACCRNVGYRGRIIISPNGVNLPSSLPACSSRCDGRHRMLFLSRIHPKKGLVELMRAWARIKKDGWLLEIVGNDSDGYWTIVDREIKSLGIADSVVWVGPTGDREKWGKYCSADCFVLPTHTENFGIVIAEALYAGLPVITTQGAPWGALIERGCGWWTPISVEAIADAMRDAMAMTDSQRAVMGRKGHDYVCDSFSWGKTAERLADDYRKVIAEWKEH